jgi:nicotinic acid mononucleotide adenylyltransferase
VELFELEPHDVASRDVRLRIARGEPIDDLVPAAVADLVRERALYRSTAGLN